MRTQDLQVVRVGDRDCRHTSWGSASPVRTGRSTIVLAESLVSQPGVPSPGSPLLDGIVVRFDQPFLGDGQLTAVFGAMESRK